MNILSNQCVLEKIENTERTRNENKIYFRLKIPVSNDVKLKYVDKLEDGKYLNFLFTEHQLKLALNRADKNPEDINEHKTIIELLFNL